MQVADPKEFNTYMLGNDEEHFFKDINQQRGQHHHQIAGWPLRVKEKQLENGHTESEICHLAHSNLQPKDEINNFLE